MCNSKNKPHKHASLIKAWADGAIIQYFNENLGGWCETTEPAPRWYDDTEYRIKPEQTDLAKYGVEVGDIWASAKVELLSIKRSHSMFEGGWITAAGFPISQSELKALVFRRGVVNKLGEV